MDTTTESTVQTHAQQADSELQALINKYRELGVNLVIGEAKKYKLSFVEAVPETVVPDVIPPETNEPAPEA